MALRSLRALLLVFALGGCRGQAPIASTPMTEEVATTAPQPHPWRFSERTAESDVHFVYRNGRDAELYTIVESLGGGVGLFDYDNDGRHDIFFTGGGTFGSDKEPSGHPPALFRNAANWQFRDVTVDAGLGRSPHYTHGCAAADFDNDGFADLVVSGYGGMQLFHNLGDGTFVETSQSAGLTETLWSTSLAWGDLNGDGNLDLYVVHYVDWSPTHDPRCPGEGSQSSLRAQLAKARPDVREICSPRSFDPLPDAVYYSNGDGTFRDATNEAQIITDPDRCGRGLGVVLGDVDLDGDVDIYVANDTDGNFLYLNRGDGCFTEVGSLHGAGAGATGAPEGSMGVDLGDFNLDGLPDLWVVNFENEPYGLYRNDGDARFTHVSHAVGIAALNPSHVGFGTLFVDIDRDGDEDLFVANGHVFYHSPLRQPALALENKGGRFDQVDFPAGYFAQPHCGRGLAAADLDDDGDIDLVVTHNDGEENALVANETAADGQWFRVRLIGSRSNRDAIGASLVLHTSAGDQLRQIKGGGSYLSQSDLSVTWGTAAGVRLRSVTVHWPAGRTIEYPVTGANRTAVLHEGERFYANH